MTLEISDKPEFFLKAKIKIAQTTQMCKNKATNSTQLVRSGELLTTTAANGYGFGNQNVFVKKKKFELPHYWGYKPQPWCIVAVNILPAVSESLHLLLADKMLAHSRGSFQGNRGEALRRWLSSTYLSQSAWSLFYIFIPSLSRFIPCHYSEKSWGFSGKFFFLVQLSHAG